MLLCPVVPVLCLLLRKRDNDAWWFREQAFAFCTFLWVYVRVSIYLSVCNVSTHVLSVRLCTFVYVCVGVRGQDGGGAAELWRGVWVCVISPFFFPSPW